MQKPTKKIQSRVPQDASPLTIAYQSLIQVLAMLHTAQVYYRGLWYYGVGSGTKLPYDTDLSSESTFAPFRVTKHDSDALRLFKQNARIHLYSLASHFYLWSKPHYRKGSFQEDLRDNLRNVAVPKTGIPLSIFVRNWFTALLFLLVVYPLIALVASLHQWFAYGKDRSADLGSIGQEFRTRLLAPNDWFNFWRLNCNIVGLHSYLNSMPGDYKMENKWEFLKVGKARGVPVSPFLEDVSSLVVKHRNEEGGMGIHFYRNAVHGGDWIIQKRLRNSEWVQQCLPPGAPLSTFRVITISHYAARAQWDGAAKKRDIETMSCVFRAGRAGAPTDHGAILFDVDTATGQVKGGTTNAHWYQLGASKARRCKWRSFHNEYQAHPDDASKKVTGRCVPGIREMLSLVEDSHLKLCAKVPICGWDVALTASDEVPVCLLEVNLSCNFFRGSFDLGTYLDFCDTALSAIHEQRVRGVAEGPPK